MPFEIVRNDITNMFVDAIVNSANPQPAVGLGTDSIGKAIRRGSISREQGDIELRLAEEKRCKAFENTTYALTAYEKEMTAENIHTEAKDLLAQREKR